MLHGHVGQSEFSGVIFLSVDRSKNEKGNHGRVGRTAVINGVPSA